MEAKKIEIVEIKVSDLNNQFGNPRKIDKKGLAQIKESLDRFGDFGLIVIDENNSIISGNQRARVMKEEDPDQVVLCKRLVGYTKSEKRAINIKANRHEGKDDEELLAEWYADLAWDLGLNPAKEKSEEKKRNIELLEPKRYEKYNYVLVCCRSELDWNQLKEKLGLDNKKELIVANSGFRRTVEARAVWYDELPVEFVPKSEIGKTPTIDEALEGLDDNI